jgi:hypothetical protein
LFRPPLTALSGSFAPAFYRAANLWCPGDRRWMVVTEIDCWTTSSGGPTPGCRSISPFPGLEAGTG